MKAIKRTWTMLKLSGSVIFKNPFLIVYGVLSSLVFVLLLAIPFIPQITEFSAMSTYTNVDINDPASYAVFEPYVTVIPDTGTAETEYQMNWPWIIGVGLPMYFLFAYVFIFFNVALISAVRKILNEQPVTFMYGLRQAWQKRLDILGWAVFSASVGSVLELMGLFSDSFIVRRIFGALSVGWKLATFLVVPVLAVEGGTTKSVVSRALSLFKKTWGENIAGNVGVTGLGLLLALVGVPLYAILLRIGSSIFPSESGVWILFVVASIPVYLIAIATFCSLTKKIFSMALYIFATEGIVPKKFQGHDLSDEWFVTHPAQIGD